MPSHDRLLLGLRFLDKVRKQKECLHNRAKINREPRNRHMDRQNWKNSTGFQNRNEKLIGYF